jgi:hypothetical protein
MPYLAHRMTRVAASSVVAAGPGMVFAFLVEPHNHRLLTGPKVRLLEIAEHPSGRIQGTVLIRGPLGIRRRARTRVLTAQDPECLSGVAELGDRTTVWVSWDLQASGSRDTEVILSAVASSLGSLDRILLFAGGKRWLRRLFAETLELLAAQMAVSRSGWVSTGSPG